MVNNNHEIGCCQMLSRSFRDVLSLSKDGARLFIKRQDTPML